MLIFHVAVDVTWVSKVAVSGLLQLHPEVLGANFASLLLVCTPLLLFSRAPRFLLLLILNFVVTTLVVANMIHATFYGGPLSAWMSKTALMHLGTLIPSILALIKPAYGVLYLDIIVAALLVPVYIRNSRAAPPLQWPYMLGAFLIACGLSAIVAAPSVRLLTQERTGLLAFAYWPREVTASLGLLPYHAWDLHTFLTTNYRNLVVPPEEVQRVRDYLIEDARRKPRSRLFGAAANRNVVLISAESFQTFLIGMEVNGQAISPHLNRLVKESIYFDNIHDQTHLGTTSDGEFLALQALHPVPVGVVVAHYRHNDFYGLPTILRKRGYATMSAHAANADFWYMRVMHGKYGIQQSYFEDSYNIRERIGPWMADRDFFDQTVPRLRALAEPFFAFILSASNHHPYKLLPKQRVLNLGKLEGTILGDYLHTANYFDQAIGEFVEQLRADGVLDRTVFAIYGDHRAYTGLAPDLPGLLNYSHEDRLRDLQTMKRVPLLIRLPNGEHAGTRSVTGGQVDIAPTLLGLLGVNDSSSIMLGQDLTANRPSLVVFRDGSFADGEHYLVKRYGPINLSTCYAASNGSTVPCANLQERHNEAMTRLEISDLIIRGNLIRTLRDGQDDLNKPQSPRTAYD